jgi:hypothetical protein
MDRPSQKPVSLGRHKRSCGVCSHPERLEIERQFIGWCSPAAIAREYRLADRASVYRHAHAFGLFATRQRNVRAALERIIEKAGDVEVTASAVVSAIQVYARINANGQWIDPAERVSVHELFERMSREELQTYAETGRLPGWFPASVPTDALTMGAKDA